MPHPSLANFTWIEIIREINSNLYYKIEKPCIHTFSRGINHVSLIPFDLNRDSRELFGKEEDEAKEEENVGANAMFTSDAPRSRTKSHPLEPDSDEENGIFTDVVTTKPKPKTAPGIHE